MLFRGSFSTSSAKFKKFNPGNVILFQIKVFTKNINETKLARYFIKVTARPSFAQLRVISAGMDASQMHLSDVPYSVSETSERGLICKSLRPLPGD